MDVEDTTIALERTLRDRFSLEQFRPGQREVIEAVLARRDVLCVMPTGGGKSLCYQLPALLLGGITLVVSPLIALMKDQVDSLIQRGLRATLLNSTLDPNEQRTRLLEIEAGRYDLVYVAPERFRSPRFVEAMTRVRPALLAVDEAHCISEWGHDFRPDYARLGRARAALGMPTCIALTATATDMVRRDIADQLDLRDPAQFVTGFDRPNLSYHVVPARRDIDKFTALAETLKALPGSAIIYASSRKRCEEVGLLIERELKRSVVIYHAGMGREERHDAQDRFMSGQAGIVVATNAFGMGVDKPDIRVVIHYNMPGTVEAYYQEAGRAGRDGLPARCLLLYAPGDRYLQEMFIDNEYPPADAIYRVYDYLRGLDADPIELTQAEIRESARLELNEGAVGTALRLLEGAGAIERFLPRENMAIFRFNSEPEATSLADRLGPQAHVQRIVLIALEGLARGRYGETIYFHPEELAAQLGLDRAALVRAIKHLVTEFPIDYVPPFRGQAIRVGDRQQRARDLKIDFSRLEQRKRQEYEKLERMVKYAESRTCRRAYILNYFGDRQAAQCGACDRCGESAGNRLASAPPIDTEAGREVLLKILSGVARVKGRVGKTVIAQMLTGSGSERMDQLGLKKLSTYGILMNAGFTRQEVTTLIEGLTGVGLVEVKDLGEPGRSKPVVTLSEAGWDWLKARGPEPLRLDLPAELREKLRRGGLERVAAALSPDVLAVPGTLVPPTDSPLVSEIGPELPADSLPLDERLKALRLAWAREANLKAFQVFTDKVLEAVVRERPTTPVALAAIKGVGPSILERYGKGILEAIHQNVTVPAAPDNSPILAPEPPASGLTTPAKSAVPSPPTPQGDYVPTEEWTWRLLDRGFSLDEASAIRGLERSAIIRHATWVARQGRTLPIRALLAPDLFDRWQDWWRTHGEALPPDAEANPGLWPLFLIGIKKSE